MSQPAVYASLPAQDAEEAFVLLEDAIGSLAGNQAAMRRLCKVQRYEPLVGWLMYYVDAHTAPQVDAALMWVRSRRHRYHWQGETVALIHEVAAEYLAAYGGQK